MRYATARSTPAAADLEIRAIATVGAEYGFALVNCSGPASATVSTAAVRLSVHAGRAVFASENCPTPDNGAVNAKAFARPTAVQLA